MKMLILYNIDVLFDGHQIGRARELVLAHKLLAPFRVHAGLPFRGGGRGHGLHAAPGEAANGAPTKERLIFHLWGKTGLGVQRAHARVCLSAMNMPIVKRIDFSSKASMCAIISNFVSYQLAK